MATLGERIREALEALGPGKPVPEALSADFAEDLYFKDPIQELRGREAFLAMNRRLIGRSRELRFIVRELVETPTSIYLAWDFRMTPKLGFRLEVEGVSRLQVRDGKVVDHRDYWDLLGGAMHSIPGVGAFYAALVKQLG